VSAPLKAFARTPGRDVADDRPAPFDPARFYYDQRFAIAEDADVLRALIAAVDWTNDLTPSQWAQWYSVALGFAPDLIVELGRGRGNSTALFTQAAARLGHTRVISLCNSYDWASSVAPRIARVVDSRWFDNLDARMTDILAEDYGHILDGASRVLLLWDAHGFEVAETVLGEILPRLQDREHLILMHDIVDNRYAGVSRSYDGQPLWKGAAWQQRTGAWDSRVNIGWMHALQDQIVAIADFSARNALDVGSADDRYARFFGENPAHAAEMRRVIGDELFAMNGHFAFISLTGCAGPFYFPAVAGRQPLAHRSDVVVKGMRQPLPVVVTPAQPWAFASTFTWQPSAEVPGAAWLRLRLRVEGGPIGVGLLAGDGVNFTVRRALSPRQHPLDMLLPVADMRQPGTLVIQTWAAPASARVRIDELSIVW